MLEFRVFNVPHGTQPLRGRLPLTPGSSLSWFGFSEEGQLSSYDSKVLIVFIINVDICFHFGFCFVLFLFYFFYFFVLLFFFL